MSILSQVAVHPMYWPNHLPPDDPSPNQAEQFTITCRLIPLSQCLMFILALILLSTLSWLIVPLHSVLMPICAVCNLIVIPLIICTATTLKVQVSERGIRMISPLHKETLYSRHVRHWSDLHTVRLRRLNSPAALLQRINMVRESRLEPRPLGRRLFEYLGRGWSQQGFLLFDFTSGGIAAFPLAGFSPEALENLFLSLSRWADPMTLNPDVIALQRDILTGQQLQISETYTQMWEQSLRQRFELTNFVPLMGGHELRNGQLKILMLLACGGFSSVYLARDLVGNRVVVKEMAVPIDDNDVALKKIHELFAREAAILSKLDHPRIVKVIDHFVEKCRDYLILDFAPGLTLRQHVQMYGPFRPEEVRAIGVQTAELLEYLHGFATPIIHRDLTPDNLVVREPDRSITLIDFGAANEFVGSVTGTLIGKQCYIPPEQFQGQASPQSDIYAVGATLHFLLTGEDPEPITTSHPRLLKPEVSEEFDQIVAKATSLDLEARVASATELRTMLEHVSAQSYPALKNVSN
jgi:tRNA A-37 threonylcarbamoyl transferase component Bud32